MPYNRLPNTSGFNDLQDAISRAITDVESLPRNILKPKKVLSSTSANFGELLILDTSINSIKIQLPQITATKIGQIIGIKADLFTNTINIYPPNNTTIDGYSSISIDSDDIYVELVATSTNEYFIKSNPNVNGSSGGGLSNTDLISYGLLPIWEWNETDLTQFDSLRVGSGVDGSSSSVVSAYGKSWIQLGVSDSTVGVVDANKSLFLPITQDLGTSYRLEAIVYKAQLGTSAVEYFGLGAHMSSSAGTSTPGTGYVGYHIPNGVPNARILTRFTDTSQTNLRVDASDPIPHTNSSLVHFDKISITVVGGTAITYQSSGLQLSCMDTSHTSGKSGLLVFSVGNNLGTSLLNFSDIKAYEV